MKISQVVKNWAKKIIDKVEDHNENYNLEISCIEQLQYAGLDEEDFYKEMYIAEGFTKVKKMFDKDQDQISSDYCEYNNIEDIFWDMLEKEIEKLTIINSKTV